MKTVYQAANAVEAHMLQDLLKQHGPGAWAAEDAPAKWSKTEDSLVVPTSPCWVAWAQEVIPKWTGFSAIAARSFLPPTVLASQVLGEHLQGAVGELPAAGLVRLVVEEEDHARARAVIEEWEQAYPPPGAMGSASSKAVPSHTVWLGMGLAVGAGLMFGLTRLGVQVERIDHDRDGLLDERWHYAATGTVLRQESDRNLDKRIDLVTHFDLRGRPAHGEQDDDFDGRFETRVRYELGQVAQAEVDTDADGVADMRQFYRHGVLQRTDYVHVNTGTALRTEHYRLGKLSSAELDTDHDGKPDVRITFDSLGNEQARQRLAPQP